MPNDTIVGAYEYYELTKEAGDAAADMTYEDMLAAGVGIEAPDDYTLVFTCPSACPYFDTVAAYNSFYPVAPALIEELGVDGFRSCDNTTMWYNGPYVVEEYIQGNTKSYIPNPSYYDAANASRFERFTVTMISDGSISLQLYQSRELDEVDLGESNITHHSVRSFQRIQSADVRETPQEVQLLLHLQLRQAQDRRHRR